MVLVKAMSEYHVSVPEAQTALKVELCPEQIEDGLAVAPVGADGVGVTVTVRAAVGLLHKPITHAA
jgi:hypothetical protein